MSYLLLDLAAIVALAAAAGWLLRRIGQPAVVGEIAVGIVLGPTLLPAHVRAHLMPATAHSALTGLGNLGLVAFMFFVGLDVTLGRGRVAGGRVPLMTAVAMGVPLVVGVGFGLSRVGAAPTSHHAAFVLFLGIAMAITAFPVLARILYERGLQHSQVGARALAVAGASDAVGWLLLAVAAALTGGGTWRLAGLPLFVLALVLVVRPALRILLRAAEGPSVAGAVVLAAGLLCSAAATDAMGLHALFGAFAFGIVTPERDRVRRWLADSVMPVVSTIALPVYFVLTGMQVDLSGFGASALVLLVTVLVLATAGKLGGAYLGARVTGLPPTPALRVAVLLNTRGLTELVVLSVGRDLGLLDANLFAAFVVMALTTTAATGPVLDLIDRRRRDDRPERPARDGRTPALQQKG